MELYSVKRVAEMIAPDLLPEAVGRVMRQIRHWTNSDILKPVGPKKTGTGVSRVYDLHGVQKAAILLELTEQGTTVDMLAGFDSWADQARDTRYWQLALRGGGPIFIGAAWPKGRDKPAHWYVISDDVLFAFVTGDDAVPEHAELFELSSLVLVNIGRIFDRIRL